jgi:hypothetical protein
MTIFLRALEAGDKAAALRLAVEQTRRSAIVPPVYEVDPATFRALPGAPFAYWASSRVRDLFRSLPRFEGTHGTVKQGLATTDDNRFVRAWWEPDASKMGTRWFPFAKGGSYSSYYADLHLCVDWRNDGAQSWAIYEARRDVVGGIIKNPDYYFRPGLTWPLRTHRFCPQALPAGSIISVRGSGIFCDDPPKFLGLFSGLMVDAMMKMLAGRDAHPQFDMGDVSAIPIPSLPNEIATRLSERAMRAWAIKQDLASIQETSHAFVLPAVLRKRVSSFNEGGLLEELADIQAEIDDVVFGLYGFAGTDRDEIRAWSEKGKSTASTAEDAEDEDSSDATHEQEALLSWSIGVAFGRFDAGVATGTREIAARPGPFDPLPRRSPGMTLDDSGARVFLVDDPGHDQDLVAAVSRVLDHVELPVPEDLRPWIARSFFALHLKMYSKSRRKAPIYWQLATPSASYSVWLYLNALSRDTVHKIQNDLLVLKLAHEQRRLDEIHAEVGPNPKAGARKQLEAQATLVEVLRTFLDEVKRVAPLWSPNLDDGVIINFAPLWRLVPQNKSWQKELKSTWDALCDGRYDWAHLAMHLWPERVVPKCAMDRSLAIAHGLEDVFWVESTDGRWTARKTPTKSVDELVKERTSPAVKSALKSLLEAPVASGKSGGRKGGGRRKASAATAEGGDA